MKFYSILSGGRKATVKNLVGILSLLCALFISPVLLCAITISDPTQTAFIRASNDKVYQVHYDKDLSVENFSARNLDGETPPRDIAAELYIATKILTALPYTVFDYKTAIDTIAEDTLEKQKWRQVATVIGSKSVDLLIAAATGGTLSTFDPVEIAKTLTGASLETIVLIKAHMVAAIFAQEASIHEQVFSELSLLVDTESEIGINTIKNSFKALLKGGKYAQKANEVVAEYLRVPDLAERLGNFFRSIVPIARDLEYFFSTTLNAIDLASLEKILNGTHGEIEREASLHIDTLFDEAAIAAAIVELEHGGFFENEAPQTVGSIDVPPLTMDGSAANVNISGNFRDPDNDRLTYTATSDNTRVATVSMFGATVTITPKSVGSTTVTVTASDGILTATQRIVVTVEATPRVVHTLVKFSGDNQQGPPGEALLSLFVVEVRDIANRGLGDIDVTFAVTAGGGSLSETTVTTDTNGQASSRLTLGDNEGRNTVRVSVEKISQAVIFNAVGTNEINIPDPNLRAKIERVLKKQVGDPITAAELATLTRLDASNSRISDLTGLKLATNLTWLNLYNNRLTTLPTGVFEGLNKVTSLKLRLNPLKTIKTGAFNGLSSLTELDLPNMQLATIESGAFNGLSNLTWLNLYNNRLTTLPTGMFEGLNKVTSLKLRLNSLKTIKTDAFNGLSSLTELDLPNMQLMTIESGAFNGLNSLQTLNLYNNKLTILPTGMFEGLNKVTSLKLRLNSLKTIKTDAFNGLSSLTELDLSNMQLTTIESGAFNGLNSLKTLNLYYNRITTLSTGVFEGLASLLSLNLNLNRGTPFTLVLELVRTDTTDLAAPGPATVVVQLAQGAPFEMTVNLSVEGGTLSATTATIARGKIQSEPMTLTQSGIRPATVRLATVPRVPSNYYGIRMAAGHSLSTGWISPHALEKISGDNQQGHAGAPLENPLIVEVQDATNRGLERVDVTFAVTAGDGSLSDTTVTTGPNGQAESWFTLGRQPGTHTVQASVEGLAQTAVFNATIESMEFDFSLPAGINLIHMPLRVTAVDGVAQTIESISDLYGALGGASTVNFLLTSDSATQGWLSYFGTFDTGTVADTVLTDSTGILAGMRVPVSVRLRGIALGINRSISITLNQGLNLVGLPLRDSRVTRVSDLLALEGIGGNVPVIILTDNGEFKLVGTAGDPGDIEITGGRSFLMTAGQAATVTVSGEGWTNTSRTAAAPPLTLKGVEVRDTTPVLVLRGTIVDKGIGLKVEDFRVTVKNLSTRRAVAAVTAPDEVGYRLTIVDIEMGRAATVGDILEISAQPPNPFIGVEPLRYMVTAEDVKRSHIQLLELVVYEIPAETELLPNYPNPFNPETWIPYRLAEDAFVALTIYNGNGQIVRTLDVGYQVAAVYENRSKAIYWDGRNEVGEPVASGVYFYHLSAGDFSATRKVVILK